MKERRHFFRVGYSSQVKLIQGENIWETTLLDVSLQGALMLKPEHWPETANGLFFMSFKLDESDIELTMEVQPTHLDETRLGVYCHHIDIDSASHLRRLIELNAGDPDLLKRELAHLLEDHQAHLESMSSE